MQISNSDMKRCSTSLIIMEMQMKTTSHMLEWLASKKTRNNKCWWGFEKRQPWYTVDGNVNCCSHYGKHMKVPEKLKNRTIIQSSNSTLGYLCKKKENTNSKRLYTLIFIAVLFVIDKIWKQPGWIKKMSYIYIYIIYIYDIYTHTHTH